MKVVNFTRLNAHTKPNLDNQISPDSYADYFGFGSADATSKKLQGGMVCSSRKFPHFSSRK